MLNSTNNKEKKEAFMDLDNIDLSEYNHVINNSYSSDEDDDEEVSSSCDSNNDNINDNNNNNDKINDNNKDNIIDNNKDNIIDNHKDNIIDNHKDNIIDNHKDNIIDNHKDNINDNGNNNNDNSNSNDDIVGARTNNDSTKNKADITSDSVCITVKGSDKTFNSNGNECEEKSKNKVDIIGGSNNYGSKDPYDEKKSTEEVHSNGVNINDDNNNINNSSCSGNKNNINSNSNNKNSNNDSNKKNSNCNYTSNSRKMSANSSYAYARIKTNDCNNSLYKCKIEKNITIKKLKKSLNKLLNNEDEYRIIYRGRLLKDVETLSKYDIKFNDILYAIKLNRKRSGNDAVLDSGITSSQLSTIGDEYNDVGKLSQNDNISKLISSMFDNSDFLKSIMDSNKQLQKLREKNSDLHHMLNDSQALKQSFEMIKNPSLMKELMRNTDRAISNIEAIPGGFNTLRRMYHNIQEPMYAANDISNENKKNKVKHYDLNSSSPPTSEAFPNPWASKDNNSKNGRNSSNDLNKYLFMNNSLFNNTSDIFKANKKSNSNANKDADSNGGERVSWNSNNNGINGISNTNGNKDINGNNSMNGINNLLKSNIFDMLQKYQNPLINKADNTKIEKKSFTTTDNKAVDSKNLENSKNYLNMFSNGLPNSGLPNSGLLNNGLLNNGLLNSGLLNSARLNNGLTNGGPPNYDQFNNNLFNNIVDQNRRNENAGVTNMLNQIILNLSKNMNVNNSGSNMNTSSDMLNGMSMLNSMSNIMNPLYNDNINNNNNKAENTGSNDSSKTHINTDPSSDVQGVNNCVELMRNRKNANEYLDSNITSDNYKNCQNKETLEKGNCFNLLTHNINKDTNSIYSNSILEKNRCDNTNNKNSSPLNISTNNQVNNLNMVDDPDSTKLSMPISITTATGSANTTSTTTSTTAATNTATNNNNNNNNISTSSSSSGIAQEQLYFQKLYEEQINSLKVMGFTDTQKCLKALVDAKGNIDSAIDILVNETNENEN
ncbi:ubiquitin-like protein, putative [Plasmodium malariae]|uniref:Ubiquitin-like protein, putative n=1 Tax=Plasmodium malariae TaxID=5858 RepID=A0A1D3PCF9_PLAMA|nr:ubiquitin-like protein, putative [Plasmodium malariae]SCN12837.1 ubiquitin-like protein, putative [Plasmodium malariae]